jgi:hypothetical protein
MSSIEDRLNRYPGGPYVLAGDPDASLFQIDNLIDFDLSHNLILDPYGTLRKCIVLGVMRKSDEMYAVAVFKKGKIIWMSDFFTGGPGPGGYSAVKLFGTQDLNGDSKVDVLVAWDYDQYFEDLVIYSWNGSIGSPIDPRDTDGTLTMQGQQEGFTIADVDGDGIQEIVQESQDDSNSAEVNVFAWNGSQYAPGNVSKIMGNRFFSCGSNLIAHVRAAVAVQAHTGGYVYTYTVGNDPLSKQPIRSISFFNDGSGSMALYAPSGGWSTGTSGAVAMAETSLIRAGSEVAGFRMASTALPKISIFYAQAPTEPIASGYQTGSDSAFRFNLVGNSYVCSTVAPSGIKDPLNVLAFIDTIISYANRSDSLGWIPNHAVTKKYVVYLDTVASHLSVEDFAGASATLATILQNVNRDSSSSLSSEAYALLRYNCEYLKKWLGGVNTKTK